MDVEGTVLSVGLHPGKDGKMPSLKVTFSTQVGAIDRYLSTSEGALKNTAKDLETLGWSPVKNSWAIDDMLDSRCLVGKRVSLSIEEVIWKDKPKWEIRWINPLGVRGPGSPVDARSLSAQLRAQMGMKEPVRGQKPPPVDSEGIPF